MQDPKHGPSEGYKHLRGSLSFHLVVYIQIPAVNYTSALSCPNFPSVFVMENMELAMVKIVLSRRK